MPRRRKYEVDVKTDPIGFLERVIIPEALYELHAIIGKKVPRDHRQFVRSLTIKRAAIATAINGYVALKTLGIQSSNNQILEQILQKIKRYDMVKNDDIQRIDAAINFKPRVTVLQQAIAEEPDDAAE